MDPSYAGFLNIYYWGSGYGGDIGVFGSTTNDPHVGFDIPPYKPDYTPSQPIGSEATYNLTKLLVLHPVASGISFMAVLYGLLITFFKWKGTVGLVILTSLATLVTFVAFVLDMVLWGIVRDRIRRATGDNKAAEYGNGEWITLAAFLSLALGLWTVLRRRKQLADRKLLPPSQTASTSSFHVYPPPPPLTYQKKLDKP